MVCIQSEYCHFNCCSIAVRAQHFYVGDSFTDTTFKLSDSISSIDNITQLMVPGKYLESRAIGCKGIHKISDTYPYYNIGEVSIIFMAFTTLQNFLPTSDKYA